MIIIVFFFSKLNFQSCYFCQCYFYNEYLKAATALFSFSQAENKRFFDLKMFVCFTRFGNKARNWSRVCVGLSLGPSFCSSVAFGNYSFNAHIGKTVHPIFMKFLLVARKLPHFDFEVLRMLFFPKYIFYNRNFSNFMSSIFEKRNGACANYSLRNPHNLNNFFPIFTRIWRYRGRIPKMVS